MYVVSFQYSTAFNNYFDPQTTIVSMVNMTELFSVLVDSTDFEIGMTFQRNEEYATSQ